MTKDHRRGHDETAEPGLGALFEAIREVQPSAAEADDAQVIAAAMWTGRAIERRRRVMRGVAAVSALAAAALLGIWAGTRIGGPERDELITIELATGDELHAIAGSEFRLAPEASGDRTLRLDRGAMLFDVRPLAEGEHFVVITPDAQVTVVGTVFAVETDGERTEVTVFEGEVRVRDASGERRLTPSSERGALPAGIARLEEAGRAAATRRTVRASHEEEGRTSPVAEDSRRVAEASTPAPRSPSAAPPPAPVAVAATPSMAVASAPSPAPTSSIAVDPARSIAVARAPVEPATLRAWIAEGRAEEALEEARRAEGAEYLFVQADALRALHRPAEAAAAYEAASSGLVGLSGAQAAYLAASLRVSELSEPEGALAILDAHGLDAEGAPLRERALVLRATALDALGREEELRQVAALYVAAYPNGSRAPWMQAHR